MVLFHPSGLLQCLAFGLPHYQLQKLQYVQNAAARLIAQKRKYDHVTQTRKALHWLPLKHRIDFKVLVHAYKAQHNLSRAYLSELITPYRPTRRLRSSCDEYRLVEHSTNTKHYGDRAFQNAAPNCGMSYRCSFANVIHLQISNIISKYIFLKRHICNILMSRQEITYIYLFIYLFKQPPIQL